MDSAQFQIITILVLSMLGFMFGKWRHDIVALSALLACVLLGLIPAESAFSGMGHPAVITVACVLIISSALHSTGAIDLLTKKILPANATKAVTVSILCLFAAFLSAFMNNVGALALLMPIGVQTARSFNIAPGKVLLPLSFASILGGMTTLIGTPTNLIVSGFREQTLNASFSMFDFAPVGIAVAFAGIIFILIAGFRFIPDRKQASSEDFETGAYLTEIKVNERSKAVGRTLRELEETLDEADAQVIGLVRNNRRISAPNPLREIHANDILVVEADHDALIKILSGLGLSLAEGVKEEVSDDAETGKAKKSKSDDRNIQSNDVVLIELAVRPGADLVGQSPRSIHLRTRHGINLLAVSREGNRSVHRLRSVRIAEGDLLLMQGTPDAVTEFANQYGCVPLADRSLRLPEPKNALIAVAVFGAAIAATATGFVAASVAFAIVVVTLVLVSIIPQRSLYSAIDWPIIIMLAALIPVANAIATTGTADQLATLLLDLAPEGHPVILLTAILIVSMTLSDVMNNAATAAVLCPIALKVATQLGVSPDPFLMAVAIGSSCSFLTPIGHQNNALILGPSGFKFGDYWKLGLPMEVIVVCVSIPLLLVFWPM